MRSFTLTPRRAAVARLASLAALCATFALDALAASDPLKPECANGVCNAMVHDEKAAIAPCENAIILLAWRQAGGATLIQCETADADMDKPSFVYNRDTPSAPAFPLTGMRYFVSSFLGDLASGKVPDKFSSHALCQPPKPSRMAAGEILIGEKVPNQDEKNPYCYRVLRISTTTGGVAIKADDNDSPKAEARHADWDKLAATMTTLIRASGGVASAAVTQAAGAGVAHVIHAKAPLRDSPDAGVAAHGYLVQGDEVTLLDRSKAADGWFKVRYVGKSGKAIDRWIHADDLDVGAPAAAAAH